MIYGFVGQAQSGKDTCAKIWEFLEFSSNHPDRFKEANTPEEAFNMFLEHYSDEECTVWQKHSFAQPLKEIVSILTGCDVEDLESETFKNTLVPEYFMDGVSYRRLLQFIGTDLFKKNFSEDIWVNILFDYYEQDTVFNTTEDGFPLWLITDVRFKNEAQQIKEFNGKLISVVRENNKSNSRYPHRSEQELNSIECDYVIENNFDIDSLILQVKSIMLQENVLKD